MTRNCIAIFEKTSALEDIAEKISNVFHSGASLSHTCSFQASACTMVHAEALICVPLLHTLTARVRAGVARRLLAHLRRIRSAGAQYHRHRCAPTAATTHPPPWQHRRTVGQHDGTAQGHSSGRCGSHIFATIFGSLLGM